MLNSLGPNLDNSPEKLDCKDLVIYTSTFYNNSEEGNIRIKAFNQFLNNAKKLNMNVVVSDGGSTNNNFYSIISSYSNVTLIKKNDGMGRDRRSALDKAMKDPSKKYFLWAEPEKEGLITVDNIRIMIQSLKDGLDIVIPKKSNDINMPHFQKWIEKRANKKIYNNLVNQGYSTNNIFDLWFGPKAFNRDGAKFFLDYNNGGEKLDKWDSIIAPVIDALKNGLSVGSIDVCFEYPEFQISHESENRTYMMKRVDQYNTIVRAILGQDTVVLEKTLGFKKK